jgi:hypothetical protein
LIKDPLAKANPLHEVSDVPAFEARQLRVAFLAGTLGQGGAEKQLVYWVRTLKKVGVNVEVYTLERGGHYEAVLTKEGTPPSWVGARALLRERICESCCPASRSGFSGCGSKRSPL